MKARMSRKIIVMAAGAPGRARREPAGRMWPSADQVSQTPTATSGRLSQVSSDSPLTRAATPGAAGLRIDPGDRGQGHGVGSPRAGSLNDAGESQQRHRRSEPAKQGAGDEEDAEPQEGLGRTTPVGLASGDRREHQRREREPGKDEPVELEPAELVPNGRHDGDHNERLDRNQEFDEK